MSAAVDIINFHLYVTNEQPENDLPAGSSNNWISAIKSVLSVADRSKPLWNGEGSCGPASTRAKYGATTIQWRPSLCGAALVSRSNRKLLVRIRYRTGVVLPLGGREQPDAGGHRLEHHLQVAGRSDAGQ